jgi:coenzyme F420-dependent glucose-6-phosphate dehydrogenase
VTVMQLQLGDRERPRVIRRRSPDTPEFHITVTLEETDTMAELRLGDKASAEQFALRELVEPSVAAEAAGMDSATVSDHFQPWRHNGGHAPFSLAWMTAVGERTQRLFLGTSVLTPTFRYNPAVIAQAFATMGCFYPNRILLGVGTGEALNEIATGCQGEWPEFKERYARLRESVR